MTNLFTICVLILLTATANALDVDKCADYLKGLANPDIVRFGGANPRTPIQEMANTFLSYVPANSKDIVQVATPVFLEFNPDQAEQFGDHQKNAFASFGPLQHSPYASVLTRNIAPTEDSSLAIILSKYLPGYGAIKSVEISIAGKNQIVTMDANGMVSIPINLHDMSWDQLSGAKPLFFRPVGWDDWFAVTFPNAYISIDELVGGMTPTSQVLPNGQSIIDPLNLKDSQNVQNDIQRDDPKNPDFILYHEVPKNGDPVARVHGFYEPKKVNEQLVPQGQTKVLTSEGGLWSRYRIGAPFKIVYLAKDPRNIGIEEQEGVVSGTGPHYIGATAEVIVNSLGQQELMTLYGVEAPKVGPDGGKLALGFSNQWVGTWLKPGQAFVTSQENYHWHLNHLTKPIAAQVFTPNDVPSDQNHYGFPRK